MFRYHYGEYMKRSLNTTRYGKWFGNFPQKNYWQTDLNILCEETKINTVEWINF